METPGRSDAPSLGRAPSARPSHGRICYLSGTVRALREDEYTTAPRVQIEVRVELKPGVMDAEAESIEKSLALLGIPSVRHVTTARIYDLEFTEVSEAEARRLADQAVERLLANPVIHRVSVRPRST
ncbi:MAG: phosphoribosylformylglycinamidine synthase subunit PurS [Thermoplasmata archaeon]